jgi:hypothetical protein
MNSGMRTDGLVVLVLKAESAAVLSVAAGGSADHYPSFGTALPDRADVVVAVSRLWNPYGDGRIAQVRPGGAAHSWGLAEWPTSTR